MDYPGVNSLVAKLLCRKREPLYAPEEGHATVTSPFHCAATENGEEYVGWRHMPVDDYMNKHHVLGKCDWAEQYMRPPYINGSEDSALMLHWRRGALDQEHESRLAWICLFVIVDSLTGVKVGKDEQRASRAEDSSITDGMRLCGGPT
ncbi:uncharacterized protein BCR38DRAFT_487332 [Pseudomassariella vexata]|uniref:Uncharacterized protein n=1 Tax=Pseudomassariella vexata TaxID=1141098 RepID=A0A1Y2DQL4_9PEZI|nr:uncharacterized protein BCR38DRAFT_487332 [Pseudomassariella vexata]ORY61582.1 hypothetical protein BCR38DRAFT_487332 [Pseudomassariella vexata]